MAAIERAVQLEGAGVLTEHLRHLFEILHMPDFFPFQVGSEGLVLLPGFGETLVQPADDPFRFRKSADDFKDVL
jgi:hypothetical protein